MNYKPLILMILVFCFSCKTEKPGIAEISGERIPIDSTIKADPGIENFIRPYSAHINKTLDSILAYNPIDLDKNDGELNTAIGNLMADAVMEQANKIFKSRTGNSIDIVLLNHGGIRSTIPKGPVTSRTAYKIMPFENEVVIVEIKGEKVQDMLEYLKRNRTAHPLSGIEILVNKDYDLVHAKISGKDIELNENYFVATSDYLQQGGDNMVFLKDPINLYRLDYKLRNLFIDYFSVTDTLLTRRDNRYIMQQ